MSNAQTAAERAQTRNDASFKKDADGLENIAKDGQKQIQKALNDIHDGVENSLKTVSGGDTPAIKPGEKTADESSDEPSGNSGE